MRWRRTVTCGAIVAVLGTFSMTLGGIDAGASAVHSKSSGQTSAETGQTADPDNKPLKDYSVGGDIAVNAPPGTEFTVTPAGNDAVCADGEPLEARTFRITDGQETAHIVMRVADTWPHGDPCFARYSKFDWYVDIDGPGGHAFAKITFRQTHLGSGLVSAKFEVACPAGLRDNIGLECAQFNERTVILLQHVPATLTCEQDAHIPNNSSKDYPLCEVHGWPKPDLKVVRTDGGGMEYLRLFRSPTDPSKVILDGADRRHHSDVVRIQITAQEPPSPTQRVILNFCNPKDDDDC
jgi:hypothetical protein